MRTHRHVLTMACDDKPGIVSALSSALLGIGGNIVESAQYGDADTGRFFIRTVFDAMDADSVGVRAALLSAVSAFEPELDVWPAGDKIRVTILVSRHDHCLLDLLYRSRIGDLPIDVVAIVSNHEVCRPIAEQHGIPFEWVPVTAESKANAEARLFEVVDRSRTELVVLARYMQILSEGACARLSGAAINIHHSFLPGFKGARPYHQAHARGVKVIGATAHFVTADLDEGPIIEQDTVRVSHADSAERMVAIGRDVESRVLGAAVRSVAEHRVFLNGIRTVVFE